MTLDESHLSAMLSGVALVSSAVISQGFSQSIKSSIVQENALR